MEKETKKKGWGGKREGAGRKPKEHGKPFSFYSTKEVESILSSVKKKTEFINNAIAFYAKNNTNS